VNPEFSAVDVDYAAIAPMLIVVAGALIGVVIEAFAPRRSRHGIQVGLAVLTLLAAFVALIVWTRDSLTVTLGGSVVIDGVSVFLMGALLLLSAMSVLIMAERFGGVGPDAFTPMGASTPGSSQEDVATRAGYATSEVYPLTLFAVLGMMVFLTANDLITMFVGLEILSLPLYILTGLARRRRLLSQEAALKYFLLGAFSSAFFLFGAALLYGFWCSSACCSRSVRCRSTRGPRTSTRARPRRSPASWPPAPSSLPSASSCGWRSSVSGRAAGTGRTGSGRSPPSRWSSVRCSR
jgi:NADH-quinone oxidoreductase subunit N